MVSFEALQRQRRHVHGIGRLARSRLHRPQQVVGVVDRGVLGDQPLLLQLLGQLLEKGVGAVGHVGQHGQDDDGREMEGEQADRIDEVADGLTGHEVLYLGRFRLAGAAGSPAGRFTPPTFFSR